MTDLTQVFEDFQNSKVELDAEFWKEQNRKMSEQNKKWVEEERRKYVSYINITFTI